MKTVRELLREKGHTIGAVVVTEPGEAGCPVGILSERDYARKVVLQDSSSRTTSAGASSGRSPCRP